ncbi:MAG: hypothetical protein JNK82_25755 [Myxococcaceae bacterium]|nr:hypothetical protein [Myxococcaceae bacterium]
MNKLALATPLMAALAVLSYDPAPQTSAGAGPGPAERAWFHVERSGYHHLIVHAKGKKRCHETRLDVDYRSVGARAFNDAPLAEGRLEGVRLLPDGETLAATVWVPAGDSVFAVAPARGGGEAGCHGLELESVELLRI